jgi:TetR/AcrR family transcriptional regulator, cholesterol catabolism regulator
MRTRGRILDAAAAAFRRQGYAATSLADIAATAGLKTGSLYFHFKTKDELVGAMLKRGIDLTLGQVQAAVEGCAPDAPSEERVRAAIKAHMAALHTQSDYAAAVLRTIDQYPTEAQRRYRPEQRRYHRYWRDLIRDAQRSGSGHADVEPSVLASLLLGAMNSTWSPHQPGRPAPRRVINALAAMVGLAP